MPLAPIGAPAWRVGGIAMACFFPPRSEPTHRLRRLSHASPRSGRSRSCGLESVAAGYGAVSVTAPARGRGGLSARPWPSRGGAAPASLVVAVSWRRSSPSAGDGSHHRPDSGQPEHTLGHETGAVWSAHSGGIQTHMGGGGVPTTSCQCCRPEARRLGTLSCHHETTVSTVATHEPPIAG